MTARVLDLPTPTGPARAHVDDARLARTRGTVVLGHGAGGGVDSRDLLALAEGLPPLGWRVIRVEQPWRVAGRRIAGPPATLDAAWQVVLDALRTRGELAGALLVLGGRSAGARVACRTAAGLGADAVLALAFPLHPPGRPERSRAAELQSVGLPLLVVQGHRDRFGTPPDLRTALAALPDAPEPAAARTVVTVPAADHGLRVPAAAPCTQSEALDLVVERVAGQLAEWARNGRGAGRVHPA